MFKYQKSIIKNCLFFFSFVLFGCITKYEATGIEEVEDILVVEGIITDHLTSIALSRSINLLEGSSSASHRSVNNAKVWVDWRDNNTQTHGYFESEGDYHINGRYYITMDALNLDYEYRLRIEIEENIYCSDFSSPIKTPDIDSIFWVKRGRGQPVLIYVAAQDEKILYYRWSYKEDWEINSIVMLDDYPYRCWNFIHSSGIQIGTAERTVVGKLTDIITQIHASNRILAVMYRITIQQNALSKRAYDYFDNIKKNAEITGDIFSPTPSELRGNITCITDPVRPVIGYIDVSTTSQKHKFISAADRLYEMPYWTCHEVLGDSLIAWFGEISDDYIEIPSLYPDEPLSYLPVGCVDCTFFGTENKPDGWPN